MFLALAADEVRAGEGIVLNPHYKDMGNRYGSEHWTYPPPRRAGTAVLTGWHRRGCRWTPGRPTVGLIARRLPVSDARDPRAAELALRLDVDSSFEARRLEKHHRRATKEAAKPLELYRAEELHRIRLNFYGFDPSYHVARYNFIYKVPKSRTPRTLTRLLGHSLSTELLRQRRPSPEDTAARTALG